ncbi:MAG TPA: hypothetical protein VI056_01465 [Candidatus Limnocylindria bacterium]
MTTITKTPSVGNEQYSRSVDAMEIAKPNGPVLGALLGAGVGSFVLGVFTTLAQAHSGFKALMDIDKNLGWAVGVGPLSGKSIYAVAAFLLTWAIAAFVMRGKNYDSRRFYIATFVLIGLGFIGTFPLFFENFPVLLK